MQKVVTMATTIRANNTLTIDFTNRQNYENLIKNSKEFIRYIISYIQSIGFELVHRQGVAGVLN